MYNNNAVYDFSVFEEQKRARKAQVFELPSVETRRKNKQFEKLKFYGKCLSLLLTSATVISGFLFGQAKLVEYNSIISNKSAELEEFKSRNKQLEMKLNEVTAPKSMLDDQTSQFVETVTISSGDKAQIS